MSIRDSLAMQLRGAYGLIRRAAQARLADTDATVDQVVIMTLLAEEDGLTQKDLVERAFSDPSTVRAILVLLEQRGLVRREVCDEDARARRVYLTSKGRRQQKSLVRRSHIGDATRLEALFDGDELRLLRGFLQRIIDDKLAVVNATSQHTSTTGIE
ncbi:MAG: MarR family winged helix-turn-helix transcriptional regulator [Pirellulaceae bacterium]